MDGAAPAARGGLVPHRRVAAVGPVPGRPCEILAEPPPVNVEGSRPMKSGTVRMLTALVIAFVGTGCASSSTTPSASVTTLQPIWPQHLQLDWSVESVRDSRKVSGYLYNRQGLAVERVQILAQALDATGAVIGQRIEWGPALVPGGDRTFFSVAGLPAANSYRVSVWDFKYPCSGK